MSLKAVVSHTSRMAGKSASAAICDLRVSGRALWHTHSANSRQTPEPKSLGSREISPYELERHRDTILWRPELINRACGVCRARIVSKELPEVDPGFLRLLPMNGRMNPEPALISIYADEERQIHRNLTS